MFFGELTISSEYGAFYCRIRNAGVIWLEISKHAEHITLALSTVCSNIRQQLLWQTGLISPQNELVDSAALMENKALHRLAAIVLILIACGVVCFSTKT